MLTVDDLPIKHGDFPLQTVTNYLQPCKRWDMGSPKNMVKYFVKMLVDVHPRRVQWNCTSKQVLRIVGATHLGYCPMLPFGRTSGVSLVYGLLSTTVYDSLSCLALPYQVGKGRLMTLMIDDHQ
jgi:hypothetical protein